MSAVARSVAPVERVTARGWVGETLYALTSVLTTSTLLVVVLRLWNADLRIPFSYRGDALLYQSVVKSILDYGWYGTNPRLGAPFGQELYDFPVANGNNLPAGLIAGLGTFTSDGGLVTNLFFLLSFPLAALTMFLVLRRLSVSLIAATVCSVLFALAPFHFIRGEGQLFLSAYYTVPLAGFLVLSVFTDRPMVARRDGAAGWRGYLSWTTFGTVALCVLVGSASIYYAAFTVALLAASGLVLSIARRSLHPAATAGALVALIGATLALNLSPSIAYRHEHGVNRSVVARPAAETELYGLKLADLLLPIEGHRLAPFARLSQRYQTTTPLPREPAGSLGIVGTIGFLALLGGFVVGALQSARRPLGLFAFAGAAVALSFFIATTGGFATLISYLITPEVRAWNRMGIFIMFFALLGIGLLLDSFRRRAGWPARAFGVLAAGIVVLGVLDQTSLATVPPYTGVAKEYRSDATFVDAIEQVLPPGAAVFQLPFLSFPEADNSPLGGKLSFQMGDYDHLRAYLHSSRLRWSYGGMRGRSQDWAFDLQGVSAPATVAAVAAGGFQGIVVDRAGYPDHGADIEGKIRSTAGAQPLVSEDGSLAFFDLRSYQGLGARFSQEELDALRLATLYPLRLELGGEFWPLERTGPDFLRWGKGARAQLELLNPSRVPRQVVLTATVGTASPGRQPLVVVSPAGSSRRLQVNAQGTSLVLPLTLRPGVNAIVFDATGVTPVHPGLPDTRSVLYFRLENLGVRETTFLRTLGKDAAFAPLAHVRSEDDFTP